MVQNTNLAPTKIISEAENIENSLVDDLSITCSDFRYIAPIIILISVFFGYHMTIIPHNVNLIRKIVVDQSNLGSVRPLMLTSDLLMVKQNTFDAETEFQLPFPSHDFVSLRFQSSIDKHGTQTPPDLFYGGVTFGITSENSHRTQFTSQNDLDISQLQHDLLTMSPRPTHLMNRSARSNLTGWQENGYAVYFSYSDLFKQGKLSSDKLQPWKRVGEDIMRIARKFRQFYITVWYPNEFGVDINVMETSRDNHILKTIIQQTLPTRTGLNELKSTAVVWMVSVNRTNCVSDQRMYRKDWTEEDHWSMHTKSGMND